MTRYVVKVYSGASLHPDRTLQTIFPEKARRRVERLQREGFAPKLLTIGDRR